MPAPPAAPLTRSAIATYALPGAGVAFMENLIQLYLLKFAADVLLVAPGLMGLLLGLSHLCDALSNPLAGRFSDRTRSRLGRRRPWLLLAPLPLALAFAALWCPPQALRGDALTAWLAGALLLFVGAQSAFHVPHLALAAELTADVHDRNRVFAGRVAWSLAGILLAAAALGVLERAADPRIAAARIAVAAGVATAALCAFAAWRLREPDGHMGRGGASPWRAFGDVVRNPHARLLLGVLFLEAIGFSTMTTSMAFATKYLFVREGATSLFLGGALVAMLASVPLWVRLARRYGRRRLWLASLAGRSAAFGALCVLPADQWLFLVGGMIAIGALFGCGAIFGPAVKADVIDDDERRTGERKEGTYFASWNLAQKSAEGAAIALAGSVLELAHFVPNAVQEGGALVGIRALFAGLPCFFYAMAALLLARLSLDARESLPAGSRGAAARVAG